MRVNYPKRGGKPRLSQATTQQQRGNKMNKQTITGNITSIKRLNNSENGNPNYSITLETDNGVAIPVTTLNDNGVNYKIHGGLEGTQVALTVKVNKYSNKLIEVA